MSTKSALPEPTTVADLLRFAGELLQKERKPDPRQLELFSQDPGTVDDLENPTDQKTAQQSRVDRPRDARR